MATIQVEVDVDIVEFDDAELIDELEGRGYNVQDYEDRLTSEEIGVIIDMLSGAKPGTIQYEIYEKLRKR